MKQDLSNLNTNKQNILTGSSKLFSKLKKQSFDREKFIIENMSSNMSYQHHLRSNFIKDEDGQILKKFIKRYKDYRKNWRSQPQKVYQLGYENYIKNKKKITPLCVDIELASICDLGCPHCFREYIITPDKIMSDELYHSVIEQVFDLGVPSIKLNWRGEPLLHPKIASYIKYAKEKNILDVSINTNATNLTEAKSRELILSGLDLIIYSFDGGTKKTYEKMRPGRFKVNSFDKVYNNIKKFSEIKKSLKAKFPITKIQMVMTQDTRDEVESFYNLFSDIVDDITVTQYNERGGDIEDLSYDQKLKLNKYLSKNNLPKDTPYIVDIEGNISISQKRLACEQLFQRMMVTYDGSVGMCCHDWGAQHSIGYVSKQSFEIDNITNEIEKKIKNNTKGFELLKNAKKPNKYNNPEKKIKRLNEIWAGEDLEKVRKKHFENKVNNLEVCKNCTFKDTYAWQKI